MSSFNLPTSFLFEATPNSAKMAEILLQLKDDGISRLVQTSEPEMPIPSSQQTVYDNELSSEAYTLPQNEACNCRKSRCLKLYCQCFAGQAICGQFCRCVECENRSLFSITRMKAIESVKERNPNAFESKYKSSTIIAEEEPSVPVVHKNGCRCRKSQCLKKYCECFQGQVHCSGLCTCVGCMNKEGTVDFSQPPLLSSRSLPETVNERHRAFTFADSHLLAKQESQTLNILQSLKRAYSAGDVLVESPPNVVKPTTVHSASKTLAPTNMPHTTTNIGLSRQFSLNSDPGVGSASKPPLVPLIKRRKLDHPTSGSLNTIGAFTSTLPPSTPAATTTATSTTAAPSITNPLDQIASVLKNSSTPITLRSTSPDTLSIAKMLSLLGNSRKVQVTIENGVGTPIAEFTAQDGKIEQQQTYTTLPDAFLTVTSSPEEGVLTNSEEGIAGGSVGSRRRRSSGQGSSGENSANTSMTDGDITNSENECNLSKMDKFEESDCDIHPINLLSPGNIYVIHVE